jgi:predicted acyl esterase
VRVELYVRSTLDHTDFYACVCDVDRAGRVLHVVDGYLRLRPGSPIADSDNVKSIVLECWPTAYRFAAGRRICLLVASGAHPRYARNLGTGEPLGEGVRMLAAHQEIVHDRAHPSALLLTVM